MQLEAKCFDKFYLRPNRNIYWLAFHKLYFFSRFCKYNLEMWKQYLEENYSYHRWIWFSRCFIERIVYEVQRKYGKNNLCHRSDRIWPQRLSHQTYWARTQIWFYQNEYRFKYIKQPCLPRHRSCPPCFWLQKHYFESLHCLNWRDSSRYNCWGCKQYSEEETRKICATGWGPPLKILLGL